MASLTERIARKSDSLALEGKCRYSEAIPFSKAQLTFDYSKIPSKYCASSDPNEVLTLYKGAVRGLEVNGFPSNAITRDVLDHIWEVKGMIESGDEALIKELLQQHTNAYLFTALLSATYNPEMAQVFAPTNPLVRKAEDKTIYRLMIRADRCIVDIHDHSNCGSSMELLILGAIFPDEIEAVKIVNDDKHSELRGVLYGAPIIRTFPHKTLHNREVKDPENWRAVSK
jgi:hypothetical protein